MSLKHAILAMLDLDSGSGYDLMKRFNQSVGFFWPSTFQQVYKDLNTLEKNGFVLSKEIEQSGKPDKKIYDITEKGVCELKQWLNNPAGQMKIKDTFLIKMFGGRRCSDEELMSDLNKQQELHQNNLNTYIQLMDEFKNLGKPLDNKYILPYQVLELGIRFEKTWLEWCEETRTLIHDIGEFKTSSCSNG